MFFKKNVIMAFIGMNFYYNNVRNVLSVPCTQTDGTTLTNALTEFQLIQCTSDVGITSITITPEQNKKICTAENCQKAIQQVNKITALPTCELTIGNVTFTTQGVLTILNQCVTSNTSKSVSVADTTISTSNNNTNNNNTNNNNVINDTKNTSKSITSESNMNGKTVNGTEDDTEDNSSSSSNYSSGSGFLNESNSTIDSSSKDSSDGIQLFTMSFVVIILQFSSFFYIIN